MNTGFSSRMKEVFTYVREEVIRLGQNSIGPEHLFLGILREGNGSAIKILEKIGVNLKDLRLIIENNIPQRKKLTEIEKDNIAFQKQTERILKIKEQEQCLNHFVRLLI